MFVQLLFFGLLSLSAVNGRGALIGGISPMTKDEFLNAKENGLVDFKFLINDTLLKQNHAEGSNQLPLSYSSYICGTKQVVAGMRYHFQFVACAQNANGKCIPEINPERCTAKFLLQPWIVRGAPISTDKIACTPLALKDLGHGTKCTLYRNSPRKRRDMSSQILTMGKAMDYDPMVKEQFDRFITKYNKPYSDPNSEEYRHRYEIFSKNLQIIKDLNELELGTATYGITEFTDYSEDEYKRYLAPGLIERKVSIRSVEMDEVDADSLPDSVDWRKKGAVTEVKNQGQCGSCWAFSTTGNIEGQWFIAKKKLISLSEQELVDCDTLDQGCNGGLPANAYKQIEKLGGLETEKEYPYEAENDKCQFKKSDVRVYINDSIALPTDEGKLAQWLAQNGPISIGINANTMQFYFGGISHPWKIFCNPKNLDHGVLIVGFGTENGEPFWIIKNSWGASWGEKGYYRIYRGGGCCGLNQEATSAIVK